MTDKQLFSISLGDVYRMQGCVAILYQSTSYRKLISCYVLVDIKASGHMYVASQLQCCF